MLHYLTYINKKTKLLILTSLYFLAIQNNSYSQAYFISEEKHHSNTIKKESLQVETTVLDSIIELGLKFLNKPYRYKGPNNITMDCSGYLTYIFGENSFSLPHSSASMAQLTNKIDKSDLKTGDLAFFTGRNAKSKRVGHVGLIVDVSENCIQMMHSCSRGIIIEDISKSDYYKNRLVKYGRLQNLEEKISFQKEFIKRHNDSIQRKKDSVSIIGVGDIMLGTNFPSDKFLAPNDGSELLNPVSAILQSADITFGNLEGVLSDEEGKVKNCKNPEICYAFRSPSHYAKYLKESGFDVMSIANNHVGDFGEIGRKNTVTTLEKEEIQFAGLQDYPFSIFTKDNVTYGFCAFAPNTGTISINDSKKAIEIVSHLDSLCDIVIVSFHGGAEGAKYRNITRQNEIYLGENRGNPYQFARTVIDAGADIVFGHGPHVTRAIDLYKDKFIAYSLGNFATYARFNLSGPNGFAPIVNVTTDNTGNFLRAEITSIKQTGEGGPIIDSENKALKEIQSLTKKDFPESLLLIQDNGLVFKK